MADLKADFGPQPPKSDEVEQLLIELVQTDRARTESNYYRGHDGNGVETPVAFMPSDLLTPGLDATYDTLGRRVPDRSR